MIPDSSIGVDENIQVVQCLFANWLSSHSKSEIKFNKWILPVYGDLLIKEVTVKRAQQILNTWAAETDQYKVLHYTAKRVFEYAINLGFIKYNPLAHVMMPKREKKSK